ncbi:hypothetical protein LRY60_04935 [Candidatus Woesebacteria bacterium]|nr:hypothetical protein [Candidatus Woesebacteria bacterium]
MQEVITATAELDQETEPPLVLQFSCIAKDRFHISVTDPNGNVLSKEFSPNELSALLYAGVGGHLVFDEEKLKETVSEEDRLKALDLLLGMVYNSNEMDPQKGQRVFVLQQEPEVSNDLVGRVITMSVELR